MVSIFTKDFGKIKAWLTESKTKSPIDIGNIYNFSIKTNNNINKIDNYKSKKIFNLAWLDFYRINLILELIAAFDKVLPEWMVFDSIFDDYYNNFEHINNPQQNTKIINLLMLKLFKKIWIAKTPANQYSINFQKIYSVILSFQIGKILEIKWINDNEINEIKKYNTDTLQSYLN